MRFVLGTLVLLQLYGYLLDGRHGSASATVFPSFHKGWFRGLHTRRSSEVEPVLSHSDLLLELDVRYGTQLLPSSPLDGVTPLSYFTTF